MSKAFKDIAFGAYALTWCAVMIPIWVYVTRKPKEERRRC